MESAGEGRRDYCFRDVLPFSLMVSGECVYMGLNTLFKAATRRGMSHYVFTIYIYAIGAAALLPAAFISHRSTVLPPPTLRIMSQIGLLGLIGSSSQIMGYTGIGLSSPTLASAISNLMPALTFILAVLFRMEKVSLKSRSSQAKIIGTVLSMLGAFMVTLYQGMPIIFGSKPSFLRRQSLHLPQSNWTLGGILLIGEYILVTLWYFIQAQIMKDYPAELIVVFLYNLCATLIAAVVGLIAEPNPNAWRVRGVGLASVLCSGLFVCCLNLSIHTWALRLKGPFYVAMFKPLSIAIAVAMGVVFLGDTLHLGSLVGSMIICVGFYTVIWGKVQEEMVEEFAASRTGSQPDHQVPLLQNYKADEV
ncbi:WAT1-related protein At3g28050-like isoform X2 [Punica granatum]|uniref:WAT1-related protein n=1 Tax=Punica granatum TaxID=22663 RepID=A0A218WFH5_PUNGR|nr:WAT1-related protein At3g28050-like isoform X2 [Punica granatum]OWM71565.1 hypothetical protein CDL15_Pgr005752 [Punica granatum]